MPSPFPAPPGPQPPAGPLTLPPAPPPPPTVIPPFTTTSSAERMISVRDPTVTSVEPSPIVSDASIRPLDLKLASSVKVQRMTTTTTTPMTSSVEESTTTTTTQEETPTPTRTRMRKD